MVPTSPIQMRNTRMFHFFFLKYLQNRDEPKPCSGSTYRCCYWYYMHILVRGTHMYMYICENSYVSKYFNKNKIQVFLQQQQQQQREYNNMGMSRGRAMKRLDDANVYARERVKPEQNIRTRYIYI